MTLLSVLETGVPVVAFLLMTAVGLDVTRADLARLTGQRRLLAVATLAQAVMLPAAAIVTIRALALDPRNADYLLLVAACPGGGMSNVYVYLARANTALSVTLTALSCILAPITMPVVVALYAVWLGREVGFALPLATLLAQLLIMAVIPVTIGAWIRDRRPEFERRYGGVLRMLSAAGVVLIVAIGIAESAGDVDRALVRGGVAAAVLVLAGMGAGWILGAVWTAPAGDRFTLAVEFAVRNLAIAMVVAVTLLGRADFVAFGALALFGQAAVLLAAVRLRARGRAVSGAGSRWQSPPTRRSP